MYCYQCEQTAKGEGCSKVGVCGKQPDVAALQDLLIHISSELSYLAANGRKVGIIDSGIDAFSLGALFATLTNVDFDPERFVTLIRKAAQLRDELKAKVAKAGGEAAFPAGYDEIVPAATTDGLVAQGESVGLKSRPDINPDILSLQHILLFGVKGSRGL